jgi:hypothetical protein
VLNILNATIENDFNNPLGLLRDNATHDQEVRSNSTVLQD